MRLINFQRWINRNRLVLWWAIFIPLLLLILTLSGADLRIPQEVLDNTNLSFQYKVLNSAYIIIMARMILLAVGVVVLLICLFFPSFRLSKRGIHWKEFEAELTNVSGEIAAEEVREIIEEESVRWSLINHWLQMSDWEIPDASDLLRELLNTVWEAFPNRRISLSVIDNEGRRAVLHPLLPRLIREIADPRKQGVTAIGFGLSFPEDVYLFLSVYPGQPDGFSRIDDNFIMILGEIFSREVAARSLSYRDLLAHFQLVPLTLGPENV